MVLKNQAGVALRGGHHCTQPLKAGADRFVDVVKEIQKFLGQ